MSSPVTNRTVNIYINHDAAQRSMLALEKEAEKLTKAIDKGRNAGKDMTREIERLSSTRQKIADLQGQIDGRLAPSFQMVQRRVQELRRELNGMSRDAPGYAAKFAEFEKVNVRLAEMKNQVNGVDAALKKTFGSGNIWSNIKQIAAGTLIGNLAMQIPTQVYNWLSGMVSGNARLADSLADIGKTTGKTVEEVTKLNSELSQIGTRTRTADLREIATGLGQIGEAANAENIANIDRIVVALGDEFGGGAREITTMLGILRNNLQDIKTGNYGDDVLRIGNALNILGQEGLATAPVVTDYANRLAGVAGSFGATSGQILGLSATLQELGVSTERGATAVSRLLQRIASKTDNFTAVIKDAGMDTDLFLKKVNEDVVGALMMVAQAAKKAGDTNQNFGRILRALNADGSGAGEVLSKLSANAELLTEKIDLASDALTRTDSIIDEFNTKNNNLAGTIDKIQKKMHSWFMNSTIMSGLEGMINKFGELIGAVDGTERAVRDFQDRQEQFNGIERTVIPLIERYEELKQKTTLSNEESEEMKTLIQQIAKEIPSAVTAFDNLGNAIDISTKKGREYIRVMRLMLQEENKEQIEDLQEEIGDLQKELDNKFNGAIQRRERALALLQEAVANGNKYYIKLHKKQVNDIGDEITGLNNRITALTGKLKMLKGEPLVDEPAPPTGDTPPEKKPSAPYISDEDMEKAQKKAEQIHKEFEKLGDDIRKINNQTTAASISNDQAELHSISQKYAEIKKRADLLAGQLSKTQAIAMRALMDTLNESEQRELSQKLNEQNEKHREEAYAASLKDAERFWNLQRQAANEAYTEGIDDFQTYQENLKAIEEAELQNRLDLQTWYAPLSAKAEEDLQKTKTQIAEREAKKRIDLEKKIVEDALAEAEAKVRATRNKSRSEGSAFAAIFGADKEHNAAQKDYLHKQYEAGKISYQQYINSLKEIDQDYLNSKISAWEAATMSIMNVMNTFLQTAQHNQYIALQKELSGIEKQKDKNRELLNDKRITQAQYDKNIAKLEKEAEKRKREADIRQFRQQKAMGIIQATISTAAGVARAFADYMWPFSLIPAGITAVLGAAQIAAIASQKPPQYAKGRRPKGKGGVPEGPSHANNGIKLVDGQSGEVVGEMEGKEAILSVPTYENNKELVNALLDSSMYQGGRKISWYHTAPAPINYSRVTTSFRQPKYATGRAPVDYTATDSNNPSNSIQVAMPEGMLELLIKLNERLDEPIKTYVPWTDIRKKQQEYEELKKAGSMGR